MIEGVRIHFDEIDSTNTWAKAHLDQCSPEGILLVTTSSQTAGRGRSGRKWHSPQGLNLYATFAFWRGLEESNLGHIPQLLAIAAVEALEKEGFLPQLKWPNDILLQGKKVGGILCETVANHGKRGVVCGIGLNVNAPVGMLRCIDRPATSLLVESGRLFDVEALLENLNDSFLAHLKMFFLNGFSPFFPFFEEKLIHKRGSSVCFHDNQTLVEGHFEKLHPNGSVELMLSDGSKKIFHAGEFIHLPI